MAKKSTKEEAASVAVETPKSAPGKTLIKYVVDKKERAKWEADDWKVSGDQSAIPHQWQKQDTVVMEKEILE